MQTRLCVFPPSQVAHFNIPRISSSVAKRLFGRPMRGGSEWPSGRESEVPRCVMQGWLTPLGAWTIPRLLQLRPCQNLAKISPPHWKSRRRRRERRRKKAGFGRSQRKEEEGAPPLAWHHRRQQLGGKKPVALKKAAACGRGGEGIPPAFLPLPLPPSPPWYLSEGKGAPRRNRCCRPLSHNPPVPPSTDMYPANEGAATASRDLQTDKTWSLQSFPPPSSTSFSILLSGEAPLREWKEGWRRCGWKWDPRGRAGGREALSRGMKREGATSCTHTQAGETTVQLSPSPRSLSRALPRRHCHLSRHAHLLTPVMGGTIETAEWVSPHGTTSTNSPRMNAPSVV